MMMTMVMLKIRMMTMTIFSSLDWHPTDHVSFSDNAHLRTIARESKVQVDDDDLGDVDDEEDEDYHHHHHHNKQDPNRCQTYDVVIFEEHDDIPKMEQVMWPRHCVQVRFLFIVPLPIYSS